MTNNSPDISFITICYNGFKDTCELIESLHKKLKSVSYEIIVVDNASREDEAAKIHELYPTVISIRSNENGGFSGGNNIGIRAAKGKYIFLINNDTYIESDEIAYLVERLESRPEIGGVSPKIRFAFPPQHIQFAGFTPLTKITLRNNMLGFDCPDDGSYDTPHPTPYLHGAAMIIKREVIEKIGIMPEIFFLYYEELDWSTSMTRAGYELWYEPRCTVFHKESQSTGQLSKLRTYFLTRNRLLYARRNMKGMERLMSVLYQSTIAAGKNSLSFAFKGRFDLFCATYYGVCTGLFMSSSDTNNSTLKKTLDTMNIIDWILYIPLVFCVCYLLLYAIASKFYRAPQYPEARTLRRIVVLFPAYKEDRVIVASIQSFLEQDYPKELYEIIVISDQMRPETNDALAALPIRLLMANYKESSKAKALAMAMDSIDTNAFDIVVIMDADNMTTPDFLSTINRVFDSGIKSVQAHRTGKNLNTDISVLDSASEEINNGFFRSGHNAVGLSAGLSGSGMAFEAEWFHQNVKYLQTAGEDKELEAMLLQQRIYTVYLPDLLVFDEKTQKKEAISNQRKRWIAAQFGALRASLPHLPKAFLQGNFDYCDKICQWMLPPRLIQLAGVFGLTFVFTVIGLILSLCNGSNEWMIAIKWWILSAAQVAAMTLPVPGGRLFTKQVGKAITQMPMLAVTMIGNLFKLKGANKKFIHTEHGEHHK